VLKAPRRKGNEERVFLPSQLEGLGEHRKHPPSRVQDRAPANHMIWHILSLKESICVNRNVLFYNSAKAGFHESHARWQEYA